MWALIIFGGFIAYLAADQARGDNDTTTINDDKKSSYILVYRVDGESNQADITYENEFGDTSEHTGTTLPWEDSFAVAEGDFVYVSAQRGGAPGDITCTIELDGVVMESSTSTGEYSTCTASGSV